MRCPRCQASLVDERYESVRLHACPNGHGALLASENRRTLTVSARASLERALEARGEGRLACGMCLRPTDVVVAQRHEDEIELDACAGCGAVWFDAGEVARLQQLPPRTSGEARTAAPARAMGLSGGGMDAGTSFVALQGIGGLIGALLDGW